jgi:hypothetical protein
VEFVDLRHFIDQHPGWFAAIFPFYLLCLWLLIATVISMTGGCNTLGKAFRTRVPLKGKKWGARSGQMRWLAGYRNCLTLGPDQNCLYLATMFLFRFMHASPHPTV